MISLLSTVLLLALSRAEIIERMRAPVINRADGLVSVYTYCPEDLRRDCQLPIAHLADRTVRQLYAAEAKRPVRFAKPGIVIHLGDVRTNVTDCIVTRVTTNGTQVVTRLWLKAPGHADLKRVIYEVAHGFFRSVEGREATDGEILLALRRASPRLRVVDERKRLADWLDGRGGVTNDEAGITLMRRVFEPGRATRRDVLIFASRLYLYPPQRDVRLALKYDCLSFREAVELASWDPLARAVALLKANDLPIAGGGRGPELQAAASAYRDFLLAFARGRDDRSRLLDLLDAADAKLNVAYEKADAHTRELTRGSGDLL